MQRMKAALAKQLADTELKRRKCDNQLEFHQGTIHLYTATLTNSMSDLWHVDGNAGTLSLLEVLDE